MIPVTTAMPAPVREVALSRRSLAWRWARQNLFRSPYDAVVTVVVGALSAYVAFRLLRFVFVTGRWQIVDDNLKLLLSGRWPVEDLDRLSIGVVLMGVWGGLVAGLVRARQQRALTAVAYRSWWRHLLDLGRRFGPILAVVLLLLVLTDTPGPWLTAGGTAAGAVAGRFAGLAWGRLLPGRLARWSQVIVLVGLPVAVFVWLTSVVPYSEWEGFLFNATAAAMGVALSFPLGVVLALGRRSKLPVLKVLSTVYIELVRASPLYVLLLLANVSLEFFVPSSLAPSKAVRAVVTFTLFTAAYLAEIVRGGLQSVPTGQYEAARSLGLSPVKQMTLVVLPQALRSVIPAQIGQFISLFKDTALAGIGLGILELLSVSEVITQQPEFQGQGLIIESLAFVALVFWVGSFTLSRESQRLERRLGVGRR